MIKLFDNWVIVVDDYNYSLARYKGMRMKKGKEQPVYDFKGHYNTLEKALKSLADVLVKDELKTASRGLDEALHTVRECHERVERLIEEVMP